MGKNFQISIVYARNKTIDITRKLITFNTVFDCLLIIKKILKK